MIGLMLAAVIMTKAADAGEIRLHSVTNDCETGYFAELVVDGETVNTGCWNAAQGEENFSISWKSSNEAVQYPKEGTVKRDGTAWKVGAAAVIAGALADGLRSEDRPTSP